MEFRVQKRGVFDTAEYDKESLALARAFTKKIYQEFGGFLKAVVLFGSTVRKGHGSDIDILIVIDDVSMSLGEEVAESYRIIVEKAIMDVSTKLHVTTLRLTSFWEYVRAGDPVAVNILRDGIALIDTGMFDPLKLLLMQGRIRPTKESIWTYFAKAPTAMHNARGNLAKAFADLYWAVMDSSHAALMAMGEVPPSPEHVPELLRRKLGKTIPAKIIAMVDEFYVMMKKLDHRQREGISGKEFDEYYLKAGKVVESMRKVVHMKNRA